MFLIVRFRVFCPRPLHSHQDPQCLPHPLQEVGATAQGARSLEWVWPNGWLSSKHTQVMSPSSPTSSATWIPSTRRSIHLTATTISCAQTTPPWFPTSQVLPNSGAFSSKQAAASTVPSLLGPSSPWKQGACHVSGRSGFQETGAELDRDLLQQRSLVHGRVGKEIVTQTLCICWKTEKIPKRPLNGKLTWPSEERERSSAKIAWSWGWGWGEKLGKEKFWNCFSRDQSRIWISTIPPTSSKSMGRSGSKRQRLLVWRVGIEKQSLPRRDHARNCQEIEELRSFCCEETDQARQARIEEQRNP